MEQETHHNRNCSTPSNLSGFRKVVARLGCWFGFGFWCHPRSIVGSKRFLRYLVVFLTAFAVGIWYERSNDPTKAYVETFSEKLDEIVLDMEKNNERSTETTTSDQTKYAVFESRTGGQTSGANQHLQGDVSYQRQHRTTDNRLRWYGAYWSGVIFSLFFLLIKLK